LLLIGSPLSSLASPKFSFDWLLNQSFFPPLPFSPRCSTSNKKSNLDLVCDLPFHRMINYALKPMDIITNNILLKSFETLYLSKYPRNSSQIIYKITTDIKIKIMNNYGGFS